MAQLAAAGAGAGIGGAFGGPVGAQFGWAAGAFVGSVIFGEDNPDIVQHGPRVQGVAVTTSAYGVMRPLNWGEVPVAGNIIDRSERRETRHEQKEKSGGKSFGPSQTVTSVTYTYDIDLCLGLGVGPADALYQLYANNRLIYDNSPGARFVKPEWLNLRFYKGEDDEQVDPTLEAIWGVGNVPAYAGEIKVMLTGFPLDGYDGQVPNFKAIILKRGVVTAPFVNFHTPNDQGAEGDFVKHPATSMMFRALTNIVASSETAPIEVIDPMTRKVVKTMECPAVDGYPIGNVSVVVQTAGFCSIPISIADQPIVSAGPSRHFYVGCNWTNSAGPDGYVCYIFDAYTYTYIGQFQIFRFNPGFFGSILDQCFGNLMFPDQNTGRLVASMSINSAAGNALANYSLVITDGAIAGVGTALWDFQAVARALNISASEIYIGDQWHTSWHDAQGTDKNGTIYQNLKVFSSEVDNVLVRVDSRGSMAYHDLTGLVYFPSGGNPTVQATVWDSTTQAVWITGTKVGGSDESAWIAFDFDMNIVNEWYPAVDFPFDVPNEHESSYMRFFDPAAGIIWSAATSSQDIISATTVVYGVNTSTLEVMPPAPWYGVPNAAYGGIRNTHGVIFNGLTQSVFASDGSVNNDWEVHERKVFSVSADVTYLSEPVFDIGKMADVPDAQNNVSELTAIPMDGFQLIQQGSARKAISQLAAAYLFDMIDTGEEAYFKLRTDVATAHIPYTDMGVVTGNPSIAGDGPPEWDTWDVMEEELPVRVEITYFNKDFNYEIGIQEAGSQEAKGVNIVRRDLSIVMDDDTAKRLADVVLHLMRIERRKVEIVVMPQWLELTAGDVITAERRDWDSGLIESMLMRIDKQMFQNGAVVLKGVRQSEGIFTSVAQGDSSLEYDPTIPYAGIMFVDFLDIPLLREIDNDPGFYVVARGSVPGWVGGELFKSTDDKVTWGIAASFTGPVIMGSVSTVLAPPVYPWVWDHKNKFTVTLLGGGELTSATKEDILAGVTNYCVIGQPGQREVVAFVNAVLVDTDTYECDTLLRARLGTEWTVGLHSSDEPFAILNAADMGYLLATQADINVPKDYRAVSNGNSLFGTEAIDYIHANTGVCLIPYAPTHWEAIRASNFDLHFYWRERTRFPQSVFWSATPSDLQQWETDIIDPDTELSVRTIASITPDALYSRADQIDDFTDISKEAIAKTYQLSDSMGRGYPHTQAILLGNPNAPLPYYDQVVALLPLGFYVCDDLIGSTILADTGVGTARNLGYSSGNQLQYEQVGSLSDGRTAVRMNAITNFSRYTMSNYTKFRGTNYSASVAMLVKVHSIGINAPADRSLFFYARDPDDSQVNLGFGIGAGNTLDGRFHTHCWPPNDIVKSITGPTIVLDQWYQVIMTWDGAVGVTYYVDDSQIGFTATPGVVDRFNCGAANAAVHCYTVDPNAFDITMQMLQFYDYVLTLEQAQALNASRSA